MDILIRDQGVMTDLQQLWDAWVKKYPRRAARYLRVIREERDRIYRPDGMSRGGTMQYKGTIPQDLYIVINLRHPGFWKEPRNMMLAHRVFMGDFRPKD